MQLTRSFSLKELTESAKARDLGIDNAAYNLARHYDLDISEAEARELLK